jgi:UDP-N-acetylmuramyl pentapeptide phosphotransferase/UDP-N-acetylglucosamine-1-phosphate transferase
MTYSDLHLPHITLLAGALTTFFICLLIVLTKSWHGHLTLDQSSGVQKFHEAPTPRVGGIALMIGLVVVWFLVLEPVKDILKNMLIASLPAFIFGSAEDLTKKVSVRARLLATIFSGVLAWWITGVSITHVDIWGIDSLLQWLPISVFFTAVAIGGFANSVNIIDGFNGLASGVLFICLTALGMIAFAAGDVVMAKVCFVLGSTLIGFFIINYPFGKIFLGDGGAYLFGFLVSWVAILIVSRNSIVSPWSVVLACGYSIVEVVFSIFRRYIRNVSPGHPDRLHLHSLIRSRIIRKYINSSNATIKNAVVAPFIWALAAITSSLSVLFYKNSTILIIAFALFFIFYGLIYSTIIRLKKN